MGEDCLNVARSHGATPIHGLEKNATHVYDPVTSYHMLLSYPPPESSCEALQQEELCRDGVKHDLEPIWIRDMMPFGDHWRKQGPFEYQCSQCNNDDLDIV